MFDDQTEVRHRRQQKKVWQAAADFLEVKLSAWIRTVLDAEAQKVLSRLPRRK